MLPLVQLGGLRRHKISKESALETSGFDDCWYLQQRAGERLWEVGVKTKVGVRLGRRPPKER